MNTCAQKRSSGFTLVELMIALLIGVVVTGAVIYVFSGSNKSYKELSRSARMQEDASFALRTLKHDLHLAGFFGSVPQYSIEIDGSLGVVTNDCSGDAAAYDFNSVLASVKSDATGGAYTCITDAVPATSVLVVKHTRPAPIAPASVDSERTYLLSNHEIAVLFDGADTPPTAAVPDGRAWEYLSNVYYIQQGSAGDPPSLSRKALRWNGSAMEMRTESMISGVEEMRFLFGVDSDGDGNLDTFLDSAAINAAGGADWGDVVAVKIYLLVRTDEEDHAYSDSQTYFLGSGAPVVKPGDKYHRTVVNTTISLRNPQFLIRGNL